MNPVTTLALHFIKLLLVKTKQFDMNGTALGNDRISVNE